ncbi:MAG: GNAT family N-acetyltransferase [Terricaulis sp.]
MNVEALERACLEAWPARTRTQRDGWEFCATSDRSGRANAVWPLSWTGADVHRAIANARAWCACQAITSTFKLADGATAPPDLAGALTAAGFTPRTETLVMTRAIEMATSPFGVELHDKPSDDIWSPLNESAPDAADAAERRYIVERIAAPRRFALVRSNGLPAAVGLGVLSGDLIGIYLMRTAPWARRNGFARDIVQTLTHWGASEGAQTAYLQVEQANEVAVALYVHEGFNVAYRYRYWRR